MWQGAVFLPYHGWDDFPLFSAGKSRHRTQGLVHWKISPPFPTELFIAWELRSPYHHHPSFRRHLLFRRFIATYTLFSISLCSWLLASLSVARFVVLHRPCFLFSSSTYFLPFKSLQIFRALRRDFDDESSPSITSGSRLHTLNSRLQTSASAIMKVFSSNCTFDYSWNEVSTANWRKYCPWNDKSTHVVGVDTLSRSVDSGTGIVCFPAFLPRNYYFCQWGTLLTNFVIEIQLRTERLITCNQSVPQWILSLFGGSPTSYVHETSYVDPISKKVTMCSTNLTWSNVLSVRETVSYSPSPSNPNSTDFNQEAKITALCGGWQKIKNKVEEASVERFSQNATRGREGFEAVLEMSRRVFGEQREHEKKQIQSWTVYVDRTRSCEIRYLFSLCIHILSVLHRLASVPSYVFYSDLISFLWVWFSFSVLVVVANVYTIIMPPNMRPISPLPLTSKKLFRYPWAVLSDLVFVPILGLLYKKGQNSASVRLNHQY